MGGAACQGYSTGGRASAKTTLRILNSNAREVHGILPRAFVFEKVVGRLMRGTKTNLVNFRWQFKKSGYAIEIVSMEADEYSERF